jgi:hypothetical protein
VTVEVNCASKEIAAALETTTMILRERRMMVAFMSVRPDFVEHTDWGLHLNHAARPPTCRRARCDAPPVRHIWFEAVYFDRHREVSQRHDVAGNVLRTRITQYAGSPDPPAF